MWEKFCQLPKENERKKSRERRTERESGAECKNCWDGMRGEAAFCFGKCSASTNEKIPRERRWGLREDIEGSMRTASSRHVIGSGGRQLFVKRDFSHEMDVHGE